MEYFGSGVKALSVPQRATITNMGAELGVTTSLFPSDERTLDYLELQERDDIYEPLHADPEAPYDRIIQINLSELEPMAACPSSPDNILPVSEIAGRKIHQVVIGSCTNSSYMDMMMVAEALKGRKMDAMVELGIAPAASRSCRCWRKTVH